MAGLDPIYATVAALSEALGTRQLSPVDIAAVLLDRIDRRNPMLHAFIDVYAAAPACVCQAWDSTGKWEALLSDDRGADG
jgi:Asp-tRNA(Asn)/Glu-tRNA(Gln) amidotransferase A subunit family amidase